MKAQAIWNKLLVEHLTLEHGQERYLRMFKPTRFFPSASITSPSRSSVQLTPPGADGLELSSAVLDYVLTETSGGCPEATNILPVRVRGEYHPA